MRRISFSFSISGCERTKSENLFYARQTVSPEFCDLGSCAVAGYRTDASVPSILFLRGDIHSALAFACLEVYAEQCRAIAEVGRGEVLKILPTGVNAARAAKNITTHYTDDSKADRRVWVSGWASAHSDRCKILQTEASFFFPKTTFRLSRNPDFTADLRFSHRCDSRTGYIGVKDSMPHNAVTVV